MWLVRASAYEGSGSGNSGWWIPIGGGESHPVIQLFLCAPFKHVRGVGAHQRPTR
jgi:hypothetical protein